MSFLDKLKNTIADVMNVASTGLGVVGALFNDPAKRMVTTSNAETGHAIADGTIANRPAWQSASAVTNLASSAYGLQPNFGFGGGYGGAYGPPVYGPPSYSAFQNALNGAQFPQPSTRFYYQNYQNMAAMGQNAQMFGGGYQPQNGGVWRY